VSQLFDIKVPCKILKDNKSPEKQNFIVKESCRSRKIAVSSCKALGPETGHQAAALDVDCGCLQRDL
jgi:hypothetical protein